MPKIHWISPAAFLALIVLLAPDRALAAPKVCTLHLPGPCPGGRCAVTADINEDGSVDNGDLEIVLAAWGPATADTAADVNHDGKVGCFDRGFVLGNWGSCPEVDPDLTGDEIVDCRDLDALIHAFGDCSIDVNQNGIWDAEDPSLDVDNNGLVTLNDVELVACFFGLAGSGPHLDFDGNGRVGPEDQQIVAAHLNQECRFDLDQSGGVDPMDVHVVIERWGG